MDKSKSPGYYLTKFELCASTWMKISRPRLGREPWQAYCSFFWLFDIAWRQGCLQCFCNRELIGLHAWLKRCSSHAFDSMTTSECMFKFKPSHENKLPKKQASWNLQETGQLGMLYLLCPSFFDLLPRTAGLSPAMASLRHDSRWGHDHSRGGSCWSWAG